MLENVETLTPPDLNDATVTWVERECHRRAHRGTGVTPLQRLAGSGDASRPCPGGDGLRAAFRIGAGRRVRRSDGTVTVEGVRYRPPPPWRHLRGVDPRVARRDLSGVDMVDGRTGDRISALRPVDLQRNADGIRRRTGRGAGGGDADSAAGSGPAPLLKRLQDERDATGLPPAWLPFGTDAGPDGGGGEREDGDGGDMP